MGLKNDGAQFESRQGQEYPIHVVQTDAGAHPAPYKMGNEGPSLGKMRQRREADHSTPNSEEVKGMWICTCTPQQSTGIVLNQFSTVITLFVFTFTRCHVPQYRILHTYLRKNCKLEIH
jgi:hypothetical protein